MQPKSPRRDSTSSLSSIFATDHEDEGSTRDPPVRRTWIKVTKARPTRPPAPPPSRPANSFILFRGDFSRNYRQQNPKSRTTSQLISQMASKAWAESSEEVRQQYGELSVARAREHRQMLAAHQADKPCAVAQSGAAVTATTGAADASAASSDAATRVTAAAAKRWRKVSTASQRKRKSIDAALEAATPSDPAVAAPPIELIKRSPAKRGRRSLDALQTSSQSTGAKASAQNTRSRSQSVSSAVHARASQPDQPEKAQPPPLPVGQAVTTEGKEDLVDGLYKALGPEKARKLAESLKRRGWTVPSLSQTDQHTLQDWTVTSSYSATAPRPDGTAAPWEVFANHTMCQAPPRAYYSDAMLEQLGLLTAPPDTCAGQAAPDFDIAESHAADGATSDTIQPKQHESPRDGHDYRGKMAADPSHQYDIFDPFQQQPADLPAADGYGLPQRQLHQPTIASTNESAVIDDLLRAIFPETSQPRLDPNFATELKLFSQPPKLDSDASVQATFSSFDRQDHPLAQTAVCEANAYGESCTMLSNSAAAGADHGATDLMPAFDMPAAIDQLPTFDPPMLGPLFFDVASSTLATTPAADATRAQTQQQQPPGTPSGTPTRSQSLRHRRQQSRSKSPGRKERHQRRNSHAPTSMPFSPPVTGVDSTWLQDFLDQTAVHAAPMHNFSRPLSITSPPPTAAPNQAPSTVKTDTEVPEWGSWLQNLDPSAGYGGPSLGQAASTISAPNAVPPWHPVADSLSPIKAPSPVIMNHNYPSSSSAQQPHHAHDLGDASAAPHHPAASSGARSSLEAAMTFRRQIPPPLSLHSPPSSTTSTGGGASTGSTTDATSTSASTSKLAKWATKATQKSRTLLDRFKSTPLSPHRQAQHGAFSPPPNVLPRPLFVYLDETAEAAEGEGQAQAQGSAPYPSSACLTAIETVSVPPDTASFSLEQQQQQPQQAGKVEQRGGGARQTTPVAEQPTIKLNGEYTREELLRLVQGRI
ncbi:uncharacterized protein PSFLO_04220 [Pseudozyma flocculosa]|uniref:HMG box domain-containing protein n=1 Tax=Pseudozyma flocculosa TaxID=84751 RepID=A0A5C3F685_9BASI|nr:uncharacterized protein PSFLO_04220 [Pseudozyma flocculosa]